MPNLDLRPGTVNALYRPGANVVLLLNGPAGWLTARTFTATLDGEALSVSEDGDTLVISAPSVLTETLTGKPYAFALTETETADAAVLVGTWTPSMRGTVSPDLAAIVVLDEVTVDVTIIAGDVTQGELNAEAAARTAADTALDGRLDTIEALGPLATDAELAAEATLARNADNLTSGTVADARIASTIARDAEVTAAVRAKSTAPATSIVWYGDSFMYAGGLQTYADDTIRGYNGVSVWTEMLTGGRLRPLANEGVSGETTAQFLARINNVIAHGAAIVCLYTPGVNDVKGVGIPAATTIANLTAIFDALAAAGSIVLTGTIPPSDLINTTEERQALFAVNRWLKNEAAARPGLIVVDVYGAVADPTTVAWKPGYHSDGTHPNGLGAFTIGTLFAAALDKIIPNTGDLLPTSDADPYELLPNPMMAGDTAGVADSVTSTGGTGTASKVARASAYGGGTSWQQWNGTGTHFFIQTAATGFVAGDRIACRMEIEVDAGAAFTANVVYLDQRDAANATVGTIVSVDLAASTDRPAPGRIVVETNPATIVATAASLRCANRTVGAGVIRIGRMSLRKVGT